MTATITVDTPDLIDAVNRAARVSPKRGAAFDLAAGIRFEVQPPWLLVKASDLEVTFRQRVRLLEASDGFPPFRLPSAVLAGWLVQLPTGEGATTTLSLDGNWAEVVSGASKARFTRIVGDSFPVFNEFEPDGLVEVDALALRLRQVSWACDRDSVPLSGVHIDGERIIGCDKAKLAMVECAVPVSEPVTVPLDTVASALRGNNGPIGLAVRDQKLLLMPDPDTQITSTIYAEAYPDLEVVLRRVVGNTPTTISRSSLQAALGRILALCKAERYPLMEIAINGAELHLSAEIDELGRVEEIISFDKPHPSEFAIRFTPTSLTGALEAATAETLTITWPDNPLGAVAITDERGFQCVAMPRR